jgi:hypothetical protein
LRKLRGGFDDGRSRYPIDGDESEAFEVGAGGGREEVKLGDVLSGRVIDEGADELGADLLVTMIGRHDERAEEADGLEKFESDYAANHLVFGVSKKVSPGAGLAIGRDEVLRRQQVQECRGVG